MNNRPTLDPISRATPTAALLLALAWSAGLYVALAGLPFFADSLTQLSRAASQDAFGYVFELEQKIYRPLETLLFFVLDQTGLDRPWIGRLVTFGMHASVCVLLHRLALLLGASRAGAALAVLLFALAPNTKSLGWVVAHGTHGRALLVLSGLLLFAKREQRPWLAALGSGACLVLALMFHPGAIELPLLCLLWALLAPTGRAAERPRSWTCPALWTQLGLGLAYIGFTLLLPNRYHGAHGLGALPANVTRASTSWLPEELRQVAVEGLRGNLGAPGAVGGGLIVVAVLLLALVLVWRGRPRLRFLILAIGVDLAPYLIAVGFTMRYGYLTFGLIAIAMALWVDSKQRLALVAFLLLAGSWGRDSLVDLGEQRTAGRMVEAVVESSRAARLEQGPERLIVLVDLPAAWGAEFDVAALNWGARAALVRGGVAGPFEFWRTVPARSSTDHVLINADAVQDRAAGLGAYVLWFDPELLDLVVHP